ncbi:MAG: PIG-L family deacetylase [Acidimicrobiia bacterium]|nr:PIG-L family deacetylase [Acidimicrobiia bacterium]
MSGDRTALVLVAHADDETLGCGGIMQRLAASGWRVEVVIVSDGIVRARGIDQDNRPAARRACTLLGVGEPRVLGIADQRFDAVPMADLANAVGALGIEPDLVVTHVGTDLNGDHRLTLEIAKIIGRP